MSNFNKRHYEAIAKILREAKQRIDDDPYAYNNVTALKHIKPMEEALINIFIQDNHRFNEERFRKATGHV